MSRVALFLSLILISSSSFSQSRRPPKDKHLDKKSFYTELTEVKKKKSVTVEDEISFRSGKMGSKFMQYDQGFYKGEYAIIDKTDIDGDLILNFQAINRNSKGQSLKWEGRIFGSRVEGTAIVSKNGKIKKHYEFVGELKVRGKKRKPITSQQ